MDMIKCENIEEVRINIDRVDRQIVKLISERSGYVKQAALFKNDVDAVKAPQRVEQVIDKIQKIQKIAIKYELNPDIAESIYRTMISCFIDFELKEHSLHK